MSVSILTLLQIIKQLQKRMDHKLRKRPHVNYKDTTKLPRPQRVKVDDGAKLYPVEILQTEGDHVKVHYAGYSSVHE